MVGLSLLTLVPGQLGGTETYVRELTRALAAHGELDYRVYLPPVAAGAGNGLPEEVVTEYRAARSLPQRCAPVSPSCRIRNIIRRCRKPQADSAKATKRAA